MSVKLGDIEVAGLQDSSGKANTNLSNLTATGKANISSIGTYDSSTVYSAGTVGAAISNKVDKGHEVIAFQAPTAENNYTWYRKYDDGWVEQGGQYVGVVGVSTGVSITLPLIMTNANYTLNITGEQNSNNWAGAVIRNGTRTTTGFQAYVWGGGSGDQIRGLCWVVQGMVA